VASALALFVAWPAEDPAGAALRRALDHALAMLPGGIAGRSLVCLLIDAAAAPPAGAVHALLADAGRQLRLAPDLEASLALDPRATTAERLAGYRTAGINRLVLRGGALDAAAQRALAAAADLFSRCALDLTFGRPGQTPAAWRADLGQALQLGAGHISLEEHEVDGAGARSDRGAALYQLAIDHLGAAGLSPYEIAHCARPGQESRQLLHGASGGDYLGIGPGSVGRVTVDGVCHALTQTEPVAGWLYAVAKGTEAASREVGGEERRTELLLTGLRLRAGIARAWFEPLAGPLEAALDPKRLAILVEDGFVALDRAGLRLTERGLPLCDAVLAQLLR
jgi:coproporphyrinogen III oxidase-like Fe-S oxidoreductase